MPSPPLPSSPCAPVLCVVNAPARARASAQDRARPNTQPRRRALQSPFSRSNDVDAAHITTPARRAAIPILLALCSAASAHPILINSGTLDISPTAITARFPITPHDLEHAGLNPDDPDAIADFAEELSGSLAILTPLGERLKVESVNIEPASAEHEARKPPEALIAYSPPQSLTFLTFQQRTSLDAHPIRRQWQLAVRRAESHDADPINLRLTSDGNVETICLAPHDSCTHFDREALTSIRLFINADASPPTIRAEIPAHLLATWRPFDLHNPDVIAPDESEGMSASIADWAERQATLTLDDQSSPLHAARVEWLLPDGANSTGPLGYWSARVAFTLAPTAPTPLERAEFTWRGFNSAVMNVSATLTLGGAPIEHRMMPGSSVVQWSAVDTK